MPGAISIFNQWTNRPETVPQEFVLPDCTVPDMSLSISEIIAKYTRAGVVPRKVDSLTAGQIVSQYYPSDQGGQASFDPDFDPLDNGQEFLEAEKKAHNFDPSDPSSPVVVEDPELSSEPDAGNGGE